MPTILELFENSTFDTSVKADKDTLVEQELTGIRVRSAVELNNPLIYGNETIRIAARSTRTLEQMKGNRGLNEPENVNGGLLNAGITLATGGLVNSISQGRDLINSKLGIPTNPIPSEVVRRLNNDPLHDSSKLVQSINDGTELGKILQGAGGNPETIAKQTIGRGIGFAKDKIRNKIYGINPDVKDAEGKEMGFVQKWTNLNKKSKSKIGGDLETYRGISNDSDIINLITPSDNVTIQPDGEFEYNGSTYKDLIPFSIGKVSDGIYTMFRSNITGLSETVSPSWNNHKFLGNPFNFYTYGGVERSVTFNLQIYAGSKTELATNWEKISQLTGMTYPAINANNLVNPPIIKFTLGDIYYQKHGYIDSLSYTIPDSGVWETEEAGAALPKFIDVNMTIKFIEDQTVLNSIYGYKKSQSAIDSINRANEAKQMTGNPQSNINKALSSTNIDNRGISATDPTKDLKLNMNVQPRGTKGSIKNTIKTLLGSGKKKSNKLETTPELTESGTKPSNSAQSALIVDKLNSKTALDGLNREKI